MNIYKKLYQIIDNKFHIKIYFLFLLILVSMFLEMLSIGILIPFFDIILSSDKSNFLYNIFKKLDISNNLIVHFSLFFLTFIFLAKTLLISLIIYFKHKFILDFNINLASRILDKVINFRLASLNDNKADYHRLVLVDASMVSNSIFQLINISSESTIILGSILILLYFEPFLLLILIFFSLFIYFSYKFFLQNRMALWGDKRKINDTYRRRYLNDLLNTNTITKLLGLNNTSYAKYTKSNNLTLRYYQLRELWNEIPRGVLELIAILFIIILFFYFILNKVDIVNIIPILSIFTLASLKIVMSVNRLIISFNQIFFAKTSINNINSYIKSSSESIYVKKYNFKKFQTIKFDNVSYAYGTKNIFKDINFKIKKNDFIGIKGKSGAGKTTLLYLIIGFLKPTLGKVTLNQKYNLNNNKINIGYIGQKPHLINDTLKKNITFGKETSKYDETKIKKIIKMMNLSDLATNTKNILDFVIKENSSNISLGQAQRISIARALYFNPDVLILDEPTSSLDRNNEEIILNILKKIKNKKTIIIVSHNLKMIRYCTQIINLDKKITL